MNIVLDDSSYIRRLLQFMCFSTSAHTDISKKSKKEWDFEIVREAFINRDIDGLVEISKLIGHIEPGEDLVYYKSNINKFAGILGLICIYGYFELKPIKNDDSDDVDDSSDSSESSSDENPDKIKYRFNNVSTIIDDILTCISRGTFPGKEIDSYINLSYYYDNDAMIYLSKIRELENISKDEGMKMKIFKSLPDQNDWLNVKYDEQ